MSFVKLGKIKGVLNLHDEQNGSTHGFHSKDMVVLHETVSPDYVGWSDIKGVSNYLRTVGYGIHGITDADGNIAWAYGLGKAIFWHTASTGSKGSGNVNTRSIGIEQISRVMLDASDNAKRWRIWWKRDKEIDATAKLVAWVSRIHKIPLVVSDGSKPGITTHWQVTKRFGVYGGHTDCWPRHLGGYYPLLRVIDRAKYFRSIGY